MVPLGVNKSISLHWRRRVVVQTLLVMLFVLGFYKFHGSESAQSALYGGLIAFVNTLLEWLHDKWASRVAGLDPGKNLGILYLCVLGRLIASVILLFAGFAVLHLLPLPLLLTLLTGVIAGLLTK